MFMEHYALPNENILNNTRNVISNPVTTFFFGPHAGSLHLVHHLCPYIPWFNVAKARQELLKSGAYREIAHENRGYFFPRQGSAYRDFIGANGKKIFEKTQKAA
jgi:fatty acid desaturase